MSDPDPDYFAGRAVHARGMAGRAATPAARNIHLELAADYDQKAAETTAPVPDPDD